MPAFDVLPIAVALLIGAHYADAARFFRAASAATLAVRRALPRLCEHQVRRLAPSARTYHDALAS